MCAHAVDRIVIGFFIKMICIHRSVNQICLTDHKRISTIRHDTPCTGFKNAITRIDLDHGFRYAFPGLVNSEKDAITIDISIYVKGGGLYSYGVYEPV